MAKISLIGQIAEIDREINMRERVYPREVDSGKMKQGEAEMLMQRIHAIRETLLFIQKHETEIRAFIAQRKQDQAAAPRGQA